MTIREVSAMTGMREDTLRYYEQIGVIPQETSGGCAPIRSRFCRRSFSSRS